MSAIPDETASRFRPMLIGDLDEVMAIEERAYTYPWTKGIMRDCLRVGYCCWIYEADGVIEAYGVLSAMAGEGHILNVTVRPESQGQGNGRKMLNQLLQLAVRHGADTVFLEVRPSNCAAVNLYEKMGFNEIGIRKDYYPGDNGREDALLFAKSLR